MQKIALIGASDKKETREDLYTEEKNFTYIFETYYKRVYNYIYYQVNDYYKAEDLTSQVFEKAMLKINTYSESKSSFEVWLFAIARNLLRDHFRSFKKYKFLSIDTIKELVSKKNIPEDTVEIAETNEELLKALRILDTRERNIIALKFGADLKNVEIAEILDLTESNVGVILYRTMKKSKKIKGFAKVASLTFVCVLGISLMQPAFAQGIVDKVLKTISLGHITIVEEEPREVEVIPVPEELKGKIFDKDGKSIKEFLAGKPEKMYTADGEEIAGISLEGGKIMTVTEKGLEEDTLVVKDGDELNKYTCFNVIFPSYLPEGYEFDRAEFYKDENGVVENTKYISLYFTNEKTGKYIYMQQRFADEETAYETGAEKVKKIKINGVDAIMYGGRNLDWETNGVIYGLSGRGLISENELIKIAESIK